VLTRLRRVARDLDVQVLYRIGAASPRRFVMSVPPTDAHAVDPAKLRGGAGAR
jgi:hypothetical protein